MRAPREYSMQTGNDPTSLPLPNCRIDNAETGEKTSFADLTPGQLPSKGTSETHARFAREQGGIPKVGAAYGGLITLYAVVFGVWQAERVPWRAHLAGVTIAAVALFPLALWHRRGHQGVPMFELICLAYGISFSAPLYFQY